MAAKKTHKKNEFSNFHLPKWIPVSFILVFAAIGGYLLYHSFAAGAANVYVATTGNDSTCVRGDSTKPCATLDQAYEIAQPGDNVQVACGSYAAFGLTSRTVLSAGPNIVFQPVTPFCASVGDINNGSLNFPNGVGSYTTWRQFILPGGSYEAGNVSANNVIIDDNHIAVDVQSTGTINNFHLVNGLQFINNTIGPACCGTGSSSPEGLRIGKPDDNSPSSSNVLIKNNLFQFPLRTCDYWPSTYQLEGQTLSAGSCPGTTCGACHDDGIHVWGFTDSTIENNRFIGAEVQGISFENSNDGVNQNINVINNEVSLVDGSAAIYVNGDADLNGGTWNIEFNTTNELIELSTLKGVMPGTVFNLKGNIGQLMIADLNGNDNGCTGYDTNATVNYAYNVWLPTSGGTSGPCSSTDLGNTNIAFVDSLLNLDLANGSTAANNLVPAAVCTAITTSDVHGNVRPAGGGSFCDAGADEFGSTSGGGGGTPAPTVSLTANPASVASGSSSTLTWSSTNATDCTASGAWSGSKATSGSSSTGALSSTSTYNLSCTGAGGTTPASATVTVTGSGGTGGTITVGETNILTTGDSNNANLLLAQSATLSQAATLQSMSFYVTAAAGKLRLGLYDASGPGGGPGNLKAQTAEITPVVGWNTANVTTPLLLQAGTYWLAYTPSSSSLAFVKGTDASSSIKISDFTYGPLPSTFSTTPRSDTPHWSFYATLSTGSGTPVVGDVNSDGHVDATDLSILLSNWNTSISSCDFNIDGKVNILDLSVLLSHYGT